MLYHITKAGELQLTGDENSESIIDENLCKTININNINYTYLIPYSILFILLILIFS